MEGRRRHIPALLGSGLVQPGAVLQMRERQAADINVTVAQDDIAWSIRAGANWLNKELKERVCRAARVGTDSMGCAP